MSLFRYRASTAEESYRRFVVPLSVFLVLGGSIGAVTSCVAPITGPMPFISSERLNRIIFVSICLFLVADGIGLFLRSRAAWHALLGYCCASVALPILATFDPVLQQRFGGYETIILGTVFNGMLTIGCYLGTWRAFAHEPAKVAH